MAPEKQASDWLPPSSSAARQALPRFVCRSWQEPSARLLPWPRFAEPLLSQAQRRALATHFWLNRNAASSLAMADTSSAAINRYQTCDCLAEVRRNTGLKKRFEKDVSSQITFGKDHSPIDSHRARSQEFVSKREVLFNVFFSSPIVERRCSRCILSQIQICSAYHVSRSLYSIRAGSYEARCEVRGYVAHQRWTIVGFFWSCAPERTLRDFISINVHHWNTSPPPPYRVILEFSRNLFCLEPNNFTSFLSLR